MGAQEQKKNFQGRFMGKRKCCGQTQDGRVCNRSARVERDGRHYCKTHDPSGYVGTNGQTCCANTLMGAPCKKFAQYVHGGRMFCETHYPKGEIWKGMMRKRSRDPYYISPFSVNAKRREKPALPSIADHLKAHGETKKYNREEGDAALA